MRLVHFEKYHRPQLSSTVRRRKEIMSIRFRHFIILQFISIGLTITVFSQDSISYSSIGEKWGWLRASLGESHGINFTGGSASASIQYIIKSKIYSIQFLYASTPTSSSVEPCSQINVTKANIHKILSIGALYGYAYKSRFFLWSVSAGIGYNLLEYSTKPDSYIHAIGLPIESQFGLSVIKTIGVSFVLFANINNQCTFYGTMLCIQLGKI